MGLNRNREPLKRDQGGKSERRADVSEFLGRLMGGCNGLGTRAMWAERGKMGGCDSLGA